MIHCKWTSWTLHENDIIKHYDFTGWDLNAFRVKCTVEQPLLKFAPLHKFFNFYLVPALEASECFLGAMLSIEGVGFEGSVEETTGFITVRATPISGNATLINVVEQGAANKIFDLFSKGENLEFYLFNPASSKPIDIIAQIPLANDDSRDSFEARYKQLKSMFK